MQFVYFIVFHLLHFEDIDAVWYNESEIDIWTHYEHPPWNYLYKIGNLGARFYRDEVGRPVFTIDRMVHFSRVLGMVTGMVTGRDHENTKDITTHSFTHHGHIGQTFIPSSLAWHFWHRGFPGWYPMMRTNMNFGKSLRCFDGFWCSTGPDMVDFE